MKKLLVMCAAVLMLTGCGYTQRDGEMIAQVKKVSSITPLICPDFMAVDVSLGVMRNGVGSMSSEDVWLLVDDKQTYSDLKNAAETGALVNVRYDVRRFVICTPQKVLRSFTLVK